MSSDQTITAIDNSNPDETFIAQTVNRYDQIDSEVKELMNEIKFGYSYHFPELYKIIDHNHLDYVNIILTLQQRENIRSVELTCVNPEVAKKVHDFCEVSMGSDISEEALSEIIEKCRIAKAMFLERDSLQKSLEERMQQAAPRSLEKLGAIVGARMIVKAGLQLENSQ